MDKITVKPLREEALKAGYRAMQERLSMPYDAFCNAFKDWDVRAFCNGSEPVGMLVTKGNELHVAVVPEVRGKWLSRRLIRDVIGPLLDKFGHAKTSVLPDNEIGKDFVSRLGFVGDHIKILRAGFGNGTFDPATVATAVAGQVISGAMQSDAASSAADAQVASADRAAQTQLQMFNTVNQQNEPYRNVGQSYLNNYFQNDGLKDYFMHQFGANDLNANLAPNWQFGLEQGQKAAAQALNAAGGTGGNYAKGLIDYTIGKSGDLYQQAYNNYTQNQSNIFNRLKSIADYGLGASGQTAQVAPSFANGIAGAQMGAGNAAASGIVGSANALSGGLTNAASWFTLPQILNQGRNPYQTPPINPVANWQSYNPVQSWD